MFGYNFIYRPKRSKKVKIKADVVAHDTQIEPPQNVNNDESTQPTKIQHKELESLTVQLLK